MSYAQRVQFAKMKLVGFAKIWWYTINENITRRQPTIERWGEMKIILHESIYLLTTLTNFVMKLTL